MKASRPIEPAGHLGALSRSGAIGEAFCRAFVGVQRRDTDGWMCRYRRPYVPWRTVKSVRAMQIYGVTVNTAAERIIHSAAYLAERVHAFTLGATDGRGSSYRILDHTDIHHAPAHARFYLQPVDADRTSSNIHRTRGSESAGTPDEEGPRYKSRRETEPFPHRVRHLQRKLNDSEQFARMRSMRCTFASPPYILELQGCRLPSFPSSRLYPSIKILECETNKKLCVVIA
ncbi:hypothetical protein G5I_08587 [Acromyrmex echinatior]|uniref:Uncharacterized protein n=1 Tax=Acromyrmex echinatior TaxID=103372 RepID=F4WRY2_ACREC|nr:hypothetical protein G5I_08587 [Acromyrmex echinatior]